MPDKTIGEISSDIQEIKAAVAKLANEKYKDVASREEIDMNIILNSALFIFVLVLLKYCLIKMGTDKYLLDPLCNTISFVTGTTLLTCFLLIFVPESVVRAGGKLTKFV